MQFRVNIDRRARRAPPARQIRELVLGAMETPELRVALRPDAEVTVRISGDRELRRLNRQFLGFDETTDVLAFPAARTADAEPYLGDIVVSWAAVQRQAPEHGHDARAELELLLVHGLLHLLGWDHVNPEQEAEMTRTTHTIIHAVDKRGEGDRGGRA